MAQWVEFRPVNQRVADSQSGHMPGLWGQVPSRGHMRGNHSLMFLSLSFSLPSLKIVNKIFLKNLKVFDNQCYEHMGKVLRPWSVKGNLGSSCICVRVVCRELSTSPVHTYIVCFSQNSVTGKVCPRALCKWIHRKYACCNFFFHWEGKKLLCNETVY